MRVSAARENGITSIRGGGEWRRTTSGQPHSVVPTLGGPNDRRGFGNDPSQGCPYARGAKRMGTIRVSGMSLRTESAMAERDATTMRLSNAPMLGRL